MSNHDHPCRGCGDDLRLIGSAHEADCLARKLAAEVAAKSAALGGAMALREKAHQLESRLATLSNELELTVEALERANAACDSSADRLMEVVAERDSALRKLKDARSALAEIANGIPGACLHATEALQALAVEKQCTCPGWCFFNPGQHHANCACEAIDHTQSFPV